MNSDLVRFSLWTPKSARLQQSTNQVYFSQKRSQKASALESTAGEGLCARAIQARRAGDAPARKAPPNKMHESIRIHFRSAVSRIFVAPQQV